MAQIPVRMPKMSMTMTEGEVSEWLVSVGDAVNEGDVICDVLTDKVDMEVESPATGVLTSIVVDSGSVDVGEPIGYIEGDDAGGFGDLLGDEPADPELIEPIADTVASPTPAEPTVVSESAAPVAESVRASPPPAPEPTGPQAVVPRARGLAHDRGLDLSSVVGSGPDGLVLTSDVETALGAATDPAAAASVPRADRAAGPDDRRVQQIRARVAAKMIESAAVPQFVLWRDLQLDGPDTRRGGISWTTVLLSAYAAALRAVPDVARRWENGTATDAGPPAVALAVATPYGLLAPAFAEPDRTDPHELDRAIRAVVATAQTGKVDAAHLQLATGSLSNLGGLGVDRFQALVTPPQGSVLSVGSVRRRPVAVDGGIGVALTVTVGLSVDHRIADGADGAALLDVLALVVAQWGESTQRPPDRA